MKRKRMQWGKGESIASWLKNTFGKCHRVGLTPPLPKDKRELRGSLVCGVVGFLRSSALQESWAGELRCDLRVSRWSVTGAERAGSTRLERGFLIHPVETGGEWTGLELEVRVKVKPLSRFCVTPWTVPYQAPPSMGSSRQEYWSGLPFPSQRIFPTQGSNPGLPHCKQMLYRLSHQTRAGRPGFKSSPPHVIGDFENTGVSGLEFPPPKMRTKIPYLERASVGQIWSVRWAPSCCWYSHNAQGFSHHNSSRHPSLAICGTSNSCETVSGKNWKKPVPCRVNLAGEWLIGILFTSSCLYFLSLMELVLLRI